ncbi:hypothetical protein R1sor_004423 [Riccia sorocarpa]|uniref:Endonuclease/exonuclease/phosphatase domain-containing protein n=1 Tax=Riccia sorocarpa TaxID=122646 RepID=A0ABD3HJK5_9MARC
MSDVYLMAQEKKGPLFTRQAVRGDRLDQARLDQGYVSRGGKWISTVSSVEQDGMEALSDHIPVIIDLKLQRGGRKARGKKGSYLKMDIDALKIPPRRQRVKTAWLEGWSLLEDPILAWELAWRKVRDVYKDFRLEDREKISRHKEMQSDLTNARENISLNATRDEMDAWQSWKGRFYSQLYTQSAPIEGETADRKASLKLIKNRIHADNNRKLLQILDGNELEWIVKKMSKEKSLGEDGLVVEIILEYWDWVKTLASSSSKKFGVRREWE